MFLLLDSLENIDDSDLDELERLLSQAEKDYAESALDQLVKEELVKRADNDKVLIKKELDHLNKELEQLRSIGEALPNRCYNLINLEQEGQKRRK